MYKRVMACCLGLLLFVNVLQAQLYFGTPPFSLRAASAAPVENWREMRIEHCQSRCAVWVSPELALTERDIQEAEPAFRADGSRVINVVFTDAGTKKWGDLTTAQVKKPIALIVHEKVIWAPMVTSPEIGYKKNVLTGNTPQGLTQEEVELIMSILRPAQPR